MKKFLYALYSFIVIIANFRLKEKIITLFY